MSNRSIAHIALGATVGAFMWTATEYGSHRWVLHGPFGKGRLKRLPLGGLHRAHHRDPEATSLVARSAGHGAVVAASALASIIAAAMLPTAAARSAGAAFSLGYSTYEINHWNAHHRPARTQWGQHMRDRHHRHHFGAPGSNLGVTLGFWDRVLGTEASPSSSSVQSTREVRLASLRLSELSRSTVPIQTQAPGAQIANR